MGSKIGYKCLSWSTTLRSFERINSFVEFFIDLESSGVNSFKSKKDKELIISKIVKLSLISSNKVDSDIKLKIRQGYELTDDEVSVFMTQAAQKVGWSGRLSNYLNKLEPLGLVYRDENDKKIKVTNLGKEFVKNDSSSSFVMELLTTIPSKNPYTRRQNQITPLGAMALYFSKYRSIDKLKIALVMSAHSFDQLNEILLILPNMSNSKIKEKILALNEGNLKLDSIVIDYADEIVRALKFCGFIVEDYKSFHLNSDFNAKLEEIINKSLLSIETFKKIHTKEQFLGFVNLLSTKISRELFSEKSTIEKMQEVIQKYDFDLIKNAVVAIINNKNHGLNFVSSDIKDCDLIEWLISIFIGKYGATNVKPNMKLDYFGLPISHAPGGKLDIEFSLNDQNYGLEVTLIKNKRQMENNETTSVARHSRETNTMTMLIAPVIHDDILDYFQYQVIQNNALLTVSTIKEFLDNIPLKGIRNYFSERFIFLKQLKK